MYCRPSLHDSGIPHRTKVQKEVFDRAIMVEQRIKDKLEVLGTLLQNLRRLPIPLEYPWSGFLYL